MRCIGSHHHRRRVLVEYLHSGTVHMNSLHPLDEPIFLLWPVPSIARGCGVTHGPLSNPGCLACPTPPAGISVNPRLWTNYIAPAMQCGQIAHNSLRCTCPEPMAVAALLIVLMVEYNRYVRVGHCKLPCESSRNPPNFYS